MPTLSYVSKTGLNIPIVWYDVEDIEDWYMMLMYLPISAGSLIDLLVVGISSEWREMEFSEKHLQYLK